MSTELTIEEKFTSLSDIDHVLLRPGVYIGDIYNKIIPYNLFVPSKNKIEQLDKVGYNAGLLKLFDEVISNSIDEIRKKTRLFDITQIDVSCNVSGRISIQDNGGIPVVFHKVMEMYLPKMLFGVLRTSSNYTQDRDGAGLNGLGAKLTNIYSTMFRVTTADGKNKFDIQWTDNMKTIDFEDLTPVTKEHFTKTEFCIDLKRFELETLDLATIRIMQKRCIDAAAANPGLKVNFKSDIAEGKLNSSWIFNSFEEFVNMHLNEDQIKNTIKYNSTKDIVFLIPNIGYNFGFVNGACCSKGTHILKVQKQITSKVLDYLHKKEMELITERDVLNNISIFVSTSVVNPDYDAQTKMELTNKIPKDALILPKSFLDSLETCEIIKQLIDFYQAKYSAEQKKNLRKLNTTLKNTKSKKLINCSGKGNDNELFLFEGTSAANGFMLAANPQNQAAYLLRGKIKNALNLTKNQIVENIELREIIAACNLQFNDPKGNIKNCKFSKIIIGSDMDFDGDHICGLLIVFFAKHFPELFLAGIIHRLISPLIIASKGDFGTKAFQEKFYYNHDEFEKAKLSLKGWEISYCKGLGSLEDRHYEVMMNEQRLMKFHLKNRNYLEVIETWFDKSTTARKELLLMDSNSSEDEDNF